MKKALIISISIFFVLQSVSGQKKADGRKAIPFDNAAVQLEPSWILNREGLNTKYIVSLDADRLLHNFRINAQLPSSAKPLEGWEAPNIGLRGHFTGHYLSAVSKLVNRYNDTLLSRRLVYMVDELYKCQQALGKGYLSAFPEREFDRLEERFGGVWAPYYTYQKIMQGLLDAYTYTGNNKAYEMVTAMAGYIDMRMAKLSPETIEKILYTAAANPANEAGAMNEVLYELYTVSKNPRHLALAKLFDRDWFVKPLIKNQDILSGLHSNTHLVLVNGLAERYATTGDKQYYNAVVNFWDMLAHHHSYANGSSSGPRPNVTTTTSLTAEHWGVPDHLSNTMTKETSESCVTHNTQKLTASLFTWTANPQYAVAYMNTFYNAVLPTQNFENGTNVYHLPLGSPRTKAFLKETDYRCCNGTSIEAFAGLNTGIYYYNANILWINLYVPSKLSWRDKGIVLKQTGNFPTDSSAEFFISASKDVVLNLNFLIPPGVKSADVYVNGKKQDSKIAASSYYSLNKKWKDGDKVKLVFHYNFYLKEMPDDPDVFAVFYGPTMLAFETSSELILKGSKADVLRNLTKESDNKFHLKRDGTDYILRPFYDIINESYGVYATLRQF